MKNGRHTGSGRALALAAAVFCLGAACEQPQVGARVAATAPSEGPSIRIEDATVDLHGHVLVTFAATRDEVPLTRDEVMALAPRFTLATLGAHPVDGLRAWRSQLLTGAQTAESLPLTPPGATPRMALANARQPGSEAPASLVDLGGGRFRHAYAAALSGFDPSDTIRVGVYLRAAPAPSLRTSTTFDFRPSGGPMEERQSVLDANCAGCHGAAPVHHDGRAGVRLCETCHTWQAADPDTIDPAALVTAATTARTDPNPLELGRLVHRIHRGRQLPTLYQSSSRANPAPALPRMDGATFTPEVDTTAIAARLPFSPENNTTAILGRKYALVGFQGRELAAGRVQQRVTNGLSPVTVVTGVAFPRDLRDCGVCHDGARQAYLVKTAISRRTCAGCHPETWYEPTPAVLDEARFAHVGGPRGDDSECANCHLQAPAGWKLYAPIELLHVPITRGARYGAPRLEIVRVEDLRPGARPQVTFRVSDRTGPIAPSLRDPAPLFEPDSPTSSFVPRWFRASSGSSLAIRVAGATSPDYGPTWTHLLSSGSATNTSNPDPLALTTGANTDEYVYTFSSTVPAAARGTWAVGMEARRRLKYGHYDAASDTFRWPGTGETVTESPDNPVVYVDTATGRWPPAGPAPRRRVVAQQNCERCHGRIELHGRTRHAVEYCVFCHTPTATDWSSSARPKVNGVVDLARTLDGNEERSIHLKVMVMRLHTGERTGSASLEGIEPFIVGRTYLDEVRFPNDLANCTVCHVGKPYLVTAVPADAPPTVANETPTARHAGSAAHAAGEPARPPIQAACTACHATGATFAHVASKTVAGVEGCPQCHATGKLAVEVVHGLEPLVGVAAGSTFSSISQGILVPRCASTACHARGATPPILEGPGAWAALVGAGSAQSSLRLVEAGAPDRSYLVYKLRGTAGNVGGIGTLMPTDGALAPSDLAAIEAWISNGAPND